MPFPILIWANLFGSITKNTRVGKYRRTCHWQVGPDTTCQLSFLHMMLNFNSFISTMVFFQILLLKRTQSAILHPVLLSTETGVETGWEKTVSSFVPFHLIIFPIQHILSAVMQCCLLQFVLTAAGTQAEKVIDQLKPSHGGKLQRIPVFFIAKRLT